MSIASALESIEERIQKACTHSGRKRENIRLMAVSKFQPVAGIEEARKNGVRLFGENRVQEAVEKFSTFTGESPRSGGTVLSRTLFRDCEVHMIGSLQRNKAKVAARIFDCIQSLDRNEIIAELAKHAGEREKPLPVLLELHTGESSKSGFPDEESLIRAAEQILSSPGLSAAGLMTMAPFNTGESSIRASFRALVHAQGVLVSHFPQADWSCLSMGMSGDFEIAVEEGSTLLRIGTAIFGERP
ncbi:MAG: YggS family pyridoxal phosphate-dependent enzyme [Treponema sp.]|nr:YggS family pyridoxal phosphate-dependent enzyme [Treponema sp.]